MAQYYPERDTCPYCGATGKCHVHCYYKRRIEEFRDGAVVWQEIRVMRVICDSCERTHAVLPDVIIPYARYGTLFIFRVLADHFIRHLSAEKTCEKYGISRNQFYRWLSLWRKHKTLWLGELCSRETDIRVGTDIAELGDTRWNQEHLGECFPELPRADIISITEALAAIDNYIS